MADQHASRVQRERRRTSCPAAAAASAAIISVGQWDQNEALAAEHDVNTALVAAPPLERPTAEAKADVVSMVYNFNSRPNEYLWLNAKYRYYDYATRRRSFER